MLKGTLKDSQVNSNDETKDGIASLWNDLTFDDTQGFFHNWVSHFAYAIKNGVKYTRE
jgi:hypothetical protein